MPSAIALGVGGLSGLGLAPTIRTIIALCARAAWVSVRLAIRILVPAIIIPFILSPTLILGRRSKFLHEGRFNRTGPVARRVPTTSAGSLYPIGKGREVV